MTTRSIPTTINAAGLVEIRHFLEKNTKLGEGRFTDSMLRAWAADAEFHLGEGNPATIEISSSASNSGAAIEYTITDAGIECTEVEIDQ